jgi:digeranylgeranylglycerophospholipid reductase
LQRMTPTQLAQMLRGDYTAGLVMGILARNPSLIATGRKRLLDRMLERINRSASVEG